MSDRHGKAVEWINDRRQDRDRRDTEVGSRRRATRKEAARKLAEQYAPANVRATYGPKRKPGKVIVKSLTTGEVTAVVDQSKLTTKRRTR